MVGLLLATALLALPAGGQAPASPLEPINGLRDDAELPPLHASAALDNVATQYLATAIASGCLCPGPEGETAAETLLDDVRLALGSDAVLLDAGMVIGYDRTAAAALTTAALDPANGAVILGTRLTLAGVATAAIPADAGWLAPPPGGVGPEIDLSGYTLVAIVTAGEGP